MNGERFTDRLNSRIQHLDNILNQPRLVYGYFTHSLFMDHRHEKIRLHIKFTVENLTQHDLPMPELIFTLDSSNTANWEGGFLAKNTSAWSTTNRWGKVEERDRQIRLQPPQTASWLQRNQKVRIEQLHLEFPMDRPDNELVLSAFIDFGEESIYSKPALNSIEVHKLE
ncbi:hypothetical protein [Halobacillus naozhouensis]|uniref:Uncharacterized protein n=1 Tax=Halobacillus naozhouensis TaxID=554880 RepID=A0ABY8J2L8_9BACI|nr:hypothetical protein [Halobacillus naozhouensis]WFT76321.1 hypothetical protein P9989_08155 [Halobacillus naozhouensis]